MRIIIYLLNKFVLGNHRLKLGWDVFSKKDEAREFYILKNCGTKEKKQESYQ